MEINVNSILIVGSVIVTLLVLMIMYLKLKLDDRRNEKINNIEKKIENLAYQNLTSRELDVIKEAIKGKTNEEIANALYISLGTVKNHKTNIYRKADVRSAAELLYKAIIEEGDD